MSSEIKYVNKDNLQTFASQFYKKITTGFVNYTVPSGTSYYTDSSCTQLVGSIASATVITVDSDICSFTSGTNIYYVSSNDVKSDKVSSVNENLADINGKVVLTTIAHANNADYAQNAKMALDLESKTQEEQNSEFNFRTSGGSSDILTGTAYLKQIYGNAFNELPRAASITDILAEAPPVEEEPVSLEDWTIIIDAATFENQLGQQKQSGNGQFSYSTTTGWSLELNTLSFPGITISDYGLLITPPSGTALPDGLTVSFNYVVSSEGIHRPVTLQEFRSTGFNLYYEETREVENIGSETTQQINVGIAHVIGEEKYIAKYFGSSSFPIIKFSEDGFSNWTTITTKTTTIGLEKYSNTFTPPSDGYIGTFLSNESTNPIYYDKFMINLIWSGKRLDAPYENYTLDNIYFYEQVNNNFIPGVVLDRIDDVADVIDFTIQNSNFYFQKRRRIFDFTYQYNDLDLYFKNVKYTREGSNIYYDCLSAAEHSDEISGLTLEGNQRIHTTEDISWIKLTTLNEENKEVQKNNSQYNVNDFGLEELITEKLNFLNELLPLSADIIYQANLIDKLRRNVITYSLQPNIDDASRATGRQNLQLIFVSCFVGARTVQVTANRIDSVGNVLEYGPKVYSDSTSKNAILQLPSLGLWNFSAIIDGKVVSINQEINYYGNYDIKLVGKRYGFKREKRNNSSSGRITYIFDAENFAPISYENDSYHLGDWANFINEVAEPVFMEPNGAITHLSRQNQRKKSDGNDFAPDAAVNGNYMVAFSKYIYVARKYDSIYDYVVFSDEDLTDENWQYYSYAHDAKVENNGKGNIKIIPNNTFYWGMFPGSYDNRAVAGTSPTEYKNYLRSIPSQITSSAFTYNLADMTNTALRTNTTNKNWSIGYKSGWDYINDLITLVTKDDDAQFSFGIGKGLCGTYSNYNTDTCFGPGFIQTTNEVSASVGGESTRLFWIWDFYGSIREPLLGFFRRNNSTNKGIAYTYYYIKMENAKNDYLTYDTNESKYLPNFPSGTGGSHWSINDESILQAGYVKISDKLVGTDKNYIKTDIVNQYGFLPINVSQAASGNGISDWVVNIAANAKITQYATAGLATTEASGSNLVRNGPRALDFSYNLISNTTVGTAASGAVRPRLTYLDRG